MSPDIEAKLALCPRLPTLPGIALRIVQVARDPDVELERVTELLSQDAALACRILRVANSSLYKQARQIRNLRQAVAVLGLNATITLTLSFSLAACLREMHDSVIDLKRFWRRSLLSGLSARVLAEKQGLEELDEIFLAALLQDIGMLALNAALPERYGSAIAASPDSHDALIDHEQARLATDHREVGVWLLDNWQLPEYLGMGIRRSHDHDCRDMPEQRAPFLACVAVSGRIADIYLAADPQAATVTARHVAQMALGMPADAFSDVLAQLSDALPEVEALFESSILSAAQAQGLTEQAQELLVSRNLLLLQAAAADRSRETEFQQLADRLYEVARRDPLTGVFNRRHFDSALDAAFEQAGGQREALSVAYLDLDEFKQVNDSYGHAMGDTILTTIAQHMQARMRPGDILARYGGEEFVVLMPGQGSAASFEVVERLRAEIETLAHPLEDGRMHYVTLSAGVASYGKGEADRATANELLQAADRALYRAKRLNRNRVIRADD